MSTHVAPELLEEAKRLREALREIEQATEGIPEQNCMIANRIARLTLGDARAAAAEGFFARGDDGQYRTDPAPGCPHGSPAGSARDCACNEPDVPCNHQWVPAQFCIKCGLQGFPEPAPTLERHWQDDADHDPGRAQTAYQAEQTRVAEGTVGGIKTLNPWAQGEVGRVVAERAALRVAMGETPQEQWQEMAARVARAEDRTMSAEAERDALRAELDRPKHETLRQLADAVERNAALKAERDALRLACNVFAADLTEAGRLCGIADDEYPLRAVERVAAERDALLRSEERHLDLIDKLESEREAAMSAWKKYRKTALQEMRPFVPGEDLTKISVNKEDVPEPGGMVARNAKNAEDQWYVARKFFEDNYELVKP